MIRILSALALIFVQSVALKAQEVPPPRTSPVAIAACRYKDSYLKIVYGQPQRRGREVFGKLVPFGQVWRTGANEATEMTLTKDIFVNGKLLMAGTYSLYSIPEAEKWTIIFNRELGMSGAYNYNQKTDALRIEVPVQMIAAPVVYEPFTILIDQRNNKADVLLLWDTTKISFAVDFIEPKP